MQAEPDLEEFRRLGHRIVDQLADHLAHVEERPLFPAIGPDELTRLYDQPLPAAERSAEEVWRELETKLLPHCTAVNHPGYMGLITPSPLPIGCLADLVASVLNQNVAAYTIAPAATAMERRTVRWLTDLVGWDERAGGNLTSGGTLANFIGLKLGRDQASGNRAQHDGLQGSAAVYGSDQNHVSVDKAVDAIGIGRSNYRKLPTDERYRVRLDLLEQAIAEDRARGVRPLCIAAVAGATNTGSVDDLAALRRIADREGMWLHADAAYGGGMLLSQRSPGCLAGLELCDSVTLDPHKWFYAPLDAGALLVRDAEQLTRSFGLQPAYLTDEMDARGERYQYYVQGFEQSRRFRSLKVWMGFQRYGTRRIGRWIDANVEQAQRLWELAEAHPRFVSALRPQMSAVCLGWRDEGCDPQASARLHRVVARRIEERGRFWLSTTVMKGRSWFRICPVNLRTTLAHMQELFRQLEEECLACERARPPAAAHETG